MGKKQQEYVYKGDRVYDIEAWRVFHLLTNRSDPDKLPIPADRVVFILDSWLSSGMWS